MRRSILATIVTFTMFRGVSDAGVIQWADWTSSDLASTSGTIGGIGVSFTGTLQFAQLASGVMVGAGAGPATDYWIENSPAPYTGNAVVDNRPPGFELLAFNLASTNTVTFSSPVVNPIMAIVSQGRTNLPVTYDFNAPFTVLSEGNGFWGDGFYSLGAGDILVGYELHGVIQFQGSFSQISWTSTEEFWHGFTFGLPRQQSPEPGTMGLLAAALVAGVLTRRRPRAN